MLSVIIITKNEASHIARCLESVSWADEIIVLDSGSDDDTVAICRQFTDKVYQTDWPGFGIQKQRALDQAKGDWVLSIDADELVTPELRAEIEQALQQNKFQGYEIPRLSSYCGRQIRHGGWWPDHVLRLFCRQSGRFSDSLVHEKVFVQGAIGRLATPLLHESFVNLEEVLRKIDNYSTLNAKMLLERGVKSSLSKAIIKALWNFFRTYIVKLSILDGSQGLMLALSNAEGTYYKYAKLLELQKNQGSHPKLISVIVSTYNRPDALEACIKSLLQQTEKNFEILIADDGSTEETQQLISAYSAKSSVVITHVYQPDCGFQLSRIRNKAVAKSKGNYIIFLDGDCMVRPNFVAKHRQLATSNYFVAGNRVLLSQVFTEEVLVKQQSLYLKKLPFFIGLRLGKRINRLSPVLSLPLGFLRYLQSRNWRKAVGCNTAMWKDDFIRANGYDELFEGWGHEDSDLVIRLIHAGIKRKEGRFAVPVLHLWHPYNDKSKQGLNYQRLLDRLERQDLIVATKGVSQYLCAATSRSPAVNDNFKNMTKTPKASVQIYKRLLSYVKPHRGLFAISIFGFLMYSGTQTLFAALIKHIIDTLQTETREGMNYLPLMFSGLIVVHGIGAYIGNYFLAKVSTNVVHTLRCEIFDQYTRLPTAYFDANNSGYMIAKITNNVGQVTQATTDALRTFVREGFTAIGLLIYLFYVNWMLSLVFIAITPIIVVLVGYVSKRLRGISKRIQESIGDMTHITSEMVGGHRVVHSYGGEEYERRRFLESSLYNRSQSLKLATTMAIHNPIMQFILAIALSFLMYLTLFLMKQASVGAFVGYLTAAFLLPKPIRSLSDANSEIQKGIAAAESLFEILDEPVELDEGTYQAERCKGALEFKNLSFTYAGANEPALIDISFKAEPGQIIALVGASGGGKSTLANLVSRFYPHDQGEILLDGVEINTYQLANLRKQLALVNQQVTLFNDTIANNIAYGALATASRSEIAQAATDAYAMEFIAKYEQGLDTEIGENGVKLSGGQRQRLALARALLKDAPILILDEATSALDTESERYIQAALQKVMSNRTTLVIAHRLSTIEGADMILVMDHGRIVERGSHQELIAKNGAYARLHSMQFKEQGSDVKQEAAVKLSNLGIA